MIFFPQPAQISSLGFTSAAAAVAAAPLEMSLEAETGVDWPAGRVEASADPAAADDATEFGTRIDPLVFWLPALVLSFFSFLSVFSFFAFLSPLSFFLSFLISMLGAAVG